MVTITGYTTRQRKDGTNFVVLELSGGVELVQSQTSGQWRAVVRKTTIPASFDEPTAKMVVGTQMPGNIVRLQAEPYEFTDKQTGEALILTHTWAYQPEGAAINAPAMEPISA